MPFTGVSLINDCQLQPMLHVNHQLLQFIDITDHLPSTAALFSRFYSHRIQSGAIKAARYLARWILRSHMQYATEIGSNCDFQVSRGNAETYLKWGGLSFYNLCVQNFLKNLTVKEFCKLGVHLLKVWSKVKFIDFLETVYSGQIWTIVANFHKLLPIMKLKHTHG